MFVKSFATAAYFALLLATANGFNSISFHPVSHQLPFQRTITTRIATGAGSADINLVHSSTSLSARRKSLRKTLAADSNARGIKPMGGGGEEEDFGLSSPKGKKKPNWVPVQGITSMSDLPKEENTVKLVDTMAQQLINGATNPTGAVSIINYEGKTYCFASSCACCQIPLTKAKVLPPNEETGGTVPRLSCDFCKATYNIRTGERVQNAESGGLMGGVVAGLFSKKNKDPLAIYDLGEKNGQVLINLA
jgi:nitrite reductase/ring-hydroxylating ferredoxin subunit